MKRILTAILWLVCAGLFPNLCQAACGAPGSLCQALPHGQSGQLLGFSAGGVPTSVTITGDCVMNSTYGISCASAVGGLVNSIIPGVGITVTGSVGSPIVGLASTSVTPGSYTNANVTVNQQGQVTGASSGGSGVPTGTAPQFLGYAGGVPTPVTMTGNCTMNSSYLITCTSSGGTVTSVGVTSPLTNTGTATAPVITISSPIGPSIGGLGLSNPTAGAIPIAEGASNFHLVTCLTGFLASTGGDPACRVLANSDLPATAVTPGSYTNANVTVNQQGLITSASNGNGIVAQHTLTEAAGAATMVVASAALPYQDDETVALNANITLTTPAAAGMATGERILVHATTSGTGWTVTFAAGAGVTLKDSVLGGSNSAVGQACTVPATGWINYAFRWDGTNLELLYCGPQPGPTAIGTSVGGTGQTSVSGWPINIPHTQTISGATNETLQTAWVTTELFTFSASATVTLPQAAWAGQVLNAIVCQNGAGTWVPAFAAAGGLTIVGTFPTFTTTASKCGDFSMTYINTTTAYITGSTAGPL